ncbi:MAG TPA: hypothetical protein VL171_01180 [Verrucomicrobiae bacterium]|nr:hypothetical protein [Verrucomicrobiae bacterium]
MSPRVTLIGAVAAMIVSGVVLYRTFSKSNPVDGATENLFQAYTQVTADEISRLLGGHGDVVVLMWGAPSDDATFPDGPPAVQALCQALQGHGLHVTKDRVTPVREGREVAWTAENYRSVLESHSQATALISFVGSPQLTDDNIRALPSPRPKLIVVRLAKLETARPLLQQGVVDAAVLPQTDAPSIGHPPKTAREWFDKYYIFATPTTVAQLSE